MLKILSHIFGFIVGLRNFLFDKKLIRIQKINKPLISIGNLTTGGTGKTPFIIKLTKLLESNNFKVAVLTGNYKIKYGNLVVVSDAIKKDLSNSYSMDETKLIAYKTNSIVASHKMKYKGAIELSNKFDFDVLLLDDGFQHRKLHRDLDILLIDSQTIDNNLLPNGTLREPINNLKRADIICINPSLKNKINYNLIYNKSVKSINQIWNYNDKTPSYVSISSIAKPKEFIKSLESQNVIINKSFILPDHYNYNQNDIIGILKKTKMLSCNSLITTEKDLLKLFKFEKIFEQEKINLFVLEIEIEILEGEEFLLNTIMELIKK